MAPDVVVVGSVNVDLVVRVARLPRPGETVTRGTFDRHGGGKGANQAVAATRLGASTALVGAVGDDDLGADAVRELEAEGVDVGAVARLAEHPTGVALIVVDRDGENQIAVASGANAAVDGAAVEHALRRLGAGVVVLSLEVSDEALLAGAAAAGTAILNPAPARELPPGLLDTAPLLTPNAGEARAMAGEDDVEAAARKLHARTGAPVVVTVGADGALLARDAGTPLRIPAPSVDAVDTTGAGDCLNGALAAELARGTALDDAVAFAVRAAALSTLAPGARAGMPTRAAVAAAEA
jgi:ribokinase